MALAWSSRQVAVCTAFHSETAWRSLFARTTRTKVSVREDGRQELGQGQVPVGRDVAQEADEVTEVAPHQLGAKDAVAGGAGLEGPLQVAVVGGATPERGARRRLGTDGALTQMVEDRLVVDSDEVFLGPARPAAVTQRLEVLLWPAGDPVSLRAWQTRVLPLRGVAQTR